MLEALRARLVQVQESYASLLLTHTPGGKPKSWPEYLSQFNILTARYATCISELQRVSRQLEHQIVLPLKPLVDPVAVGIAPAPPPGAPPIQLDPNFIPDVLLRTRVIPDIEKDETKRTAEAHEGDADKVAEYLEENPSALAEIQNTKGTAAFEHSQTNKAIQNKLKESLDEDLENHETVIEFAQDIFADLNELKKDLKKWNSADQQRKIIDFKYREHEEIEEIELANVMMFSGIDNMEYEKDSRWQTPHIRRNVVTRQGQLAKQTGRGEITPEDQQSSELVAKPDSVVVESTTASSQMNEDDDDDDDDLEELEGLEDDDDE